MGLISDLGGLGGIGSLMSGITGIFSARQNRKNAKFQRKMAKQNFELQKEYAAKNYDLQVGAQDMQREQFAQMMAMQDPAVKRQMLEDAGFNPFTQDNALGSVSSPSSSAGSVGSILAPQYETNGIAQMEQLRQSNLSNSLGAIGDLLDNIARIGTLDSTVSEARVRANIAKATEQASIDIANNQSRISASEAAMSEMHLKQYPQELKAALFHTLNEIDLLSSEKLKTDAETHKVYFEQDYIHQQKIALIQQMDKVSHEIQGIKYDNEYKRVLANMADTYIDAMISDMYSRANASNAAARASISQAELNTANTRLARINGFWAGMPQTYDQYVYARNQADNAHPLGIFMPGSLGNVLYTSRMLDNDWRRSETWNKYNAPWIQFGGNAFRQIGNAIKPRGKQGKYFYKGK